MFFVWDRSFDEKEVEVGEKIDDDDRDRKWKKKVKKWQNKNWKKNDGNYKSMIGSLCLCVHLTRARGTMCVYACLYVKFLTGPRPVWKMSFLNVYLEFYCNLL